MKYERRLYDTFQPDHYDIELKLERAKRAFSGTVTITGTAHEKNFIRLHAKDLAIQSVNIDGQAVAHEYEADVLIIQSGLSTGKRTLTIIFEGTITDAMHGLYPCYYDHDSVKKELLVTQFESHHAREVFPCIDEPEAKATFDLTLMTDTAVTALSNMPIAKTSRTHDWQITRFQTTPRMSTYLLAFVVGELQKHSTRSKHGVEVAVWSTKAHPLSRLSFALDIATRAVDFYDDYFGVSYPLPKADHVAVPDFSAWAMENWGLITYRESALLAEMTASQQTKEYIASVIAHELSHQWFGNLVTMRWWNNLWLNESFASLMEYICIDALEPSWHVWNSMTMHESVPALQRDSIEGVQAVQTEVLHPDEIGTLFDGAIVYAKGARLMRMLMEYIGEDIFRAGLESYFSQFAYKNTEENDLWDVLGITSGKDVALVMRAWISQPGYPLVTVSSNGLSQERFFIGDHDGDNSLWPIPLFASKPELPELFSEKATKTIVPKNVILNTEDRAHFITKYPRAHLTWQRKQIETQQLSPVDRLRLLHECKLLVTGEQLNAGELVSLIASFRHETNESVWPMVISTAKSLALFASSVKSELTLQQFYSELIAEPFSKLGWHPLADEPIANTTLRADILSLVPFTHDPQYAREGIELFYDLPIESIDANVRIPALRVALQHDSKIFDDLFAYYTAASDPELKSDLMYALSTATTPHAQQVLLESMTHSTVIRPQDVKLWYMLLLHVPKNQQIAFEWLLQHWDWITETFGSDMSYDRFVHYCGNYLTTQQQLSDFTSFFNDKRSIPSLKRAIAIAESQIAARVRLIKNQHKNVLNALERTLS